MSMVADLEEQKIRKVRSSILDRISGTGTRMKKMPGLLFTGIRAI
jgi:hypothetical protein